MSKNHRRERFYHGPRDTLDTDMRALRKKRTHTPTAPEFFVPSFAMRRPLLKTPETIDFVRQLKERMPKNWRVFTPGSLALTLVEQKGLVKEFRQQDECPDPERIEKVARSVARQLKQSLVGVPRRLEIPTGQVFAFGEKHNRRKLGVIPADWRGFSAPYDERGPDKVVLPMPIIVRETNIAIGSIANEFAGNGSLASGLRTMAMGRTPHITFAQKVEGGSISQTEEHAFAGLIDEIMPPTLTAFDPILFLRLGREQTEPEVIHIRSPRRENLGLI